MVAIINSYGIFISEYLELISMRKHTDPYQMGPSPIASEDEPELADSMHFDKMQHSPGNREGGFRMGDNTSGTQRHMEEGEDSASSVHKSEQEQLDAMIEDYKNKIKTAVSARLLGKPTKIKMSGNKKLIAQIVKLIKMETDYLNSIMTGQGADAPILMKMKAEIDQEANMLDRMLGTTDFWPFK
jgi:hypothetical protein